MIVIVITIVLLIGAGEMVKPIIDTKNPLIYLEYEGPTIPVNRTMIRTLKEIETDTPHEFFKVWFNEDCFIVTAEKVINGEIVWRDQYKYELTRKKRPWGVSGMREIAGKTILLRFDNEGRIER